jgi:hypothetical protein
MSMIGMGEPGVQPLLKWVDIQDFSPGIVGNISAPQEAPIGSAQWHYSSTYQSYGWCVSPMGGLMPGPLRLSSLDLGALYEATAGGTSNDNFEVDQVAILAVNIVSPLANSYGSVFGDADFAFHVLLESHVDLTGGTTYDRYVTWWIFDDGMTATLVDELTEGPTTMYGAGALEITRSRSAASSADNVGYITAVRSYVSPNSLFEVGTFPDLATPTVDSYDPIDAATPTFGLVSHQGRLLSLARASYAHTHAGRGDLMATETFKWWAANDLVSAFEAETQAFVEENPTGYSSIVSMNANELFLVKNQGGGVVVRGDVSNPTVVRLPGVASGFGYTNKGVVTDIGYVYGTRNGVFVWNGGDTSECLSPRFDGDFWIPDEDGVQPSMLARSRGTFAYQYPFIYVPNGWMFDVRIKSWTRLQERSSVDPGDIPIHYLTTGNGTVLASPAFITDTRLTIADRWDQHSPATSYQWVSQPIAIDRVKDAWVREVSISTSGAGRVQLTLIGDGSTGVTELFNVSGTDAVSISRRFAQAITRAPVVIVQALGVTSNDPAPIINRISLGILEGNELAETATV